MNKEVKKYAILGLYSTQTCVWRKSETWNMERKDLCKNENIWIFHTLILIKDDSTIAQLFFASTPKKCFLILIKIAAAI